MEKHLHRPSPRGEVGPRSGTDEVESCGMIAAGIGEASFVHLIRHLACHLSAGQALPLKGKPLDNQSVISYGVFMVYCAQGL